MQEYSRQLYEGWVRDQEWDLFLDYTEGELTSLFLYFQKSITYGDGVQQCRLLYSWGIVIHLYTDKEGMCEQHQVTEADRSHYIMY